MSSDDEDFKPDEPSSKKVKKSEGTGTGRGRKKKESKETSAKTDKTKSTSPKRKTPKGKKSSPKEEVKNEKKQGKIIKKKGKAKPDNDDESEQQEEEKPPTQDDENEDFELNEEEEEKDKDEDEDVAESDSDEGKSAKKKKVIDNFLRVIKRAEIKPQQEKGRKEVELKEKSLGYQEILEYMQKQNRPYSLQNIYDNLHAKIKKGPMQKALDAMVENGDLQVKEFGKAKVYLLNQESIPQVDEKEMEKIQKNVAAKKAELTEAQADVKELQAAVKDLNAQLTNEQIKVEIEKYKKQIKDLENKLVVYESGNYPKISDQEMNQAEAKVKIFESEYKKRKRICLALLGWVCEITEKKIAEAKEEVGIEDDE